MLFDFQKFIEELRNNPEKKEVIEKYEKAFWPIEGGLTDQHWFTDYIDKFTPVEYKTPVELVDDFDWKLLMQLVAGSFSSDGKFATKDEDGNELETPDFVISVSSWDQVVVKKVSELRWFQVLRLYEIYAEEQMNLEILIKEDEKEKEAIDAQRDARLKKRQLILDNFQSEQAKLEEAKEKEGKIDDLMGKL